MRRFREQVVVVTGAGSGIGLATASAFAAEGARVHLVDIDSDRLEAVPIDAAGRHVIDCRDAAALRDLAARIGRVDVLHNNAGVGHASAMLDATDEDWEWVMSLNVWGVIHGVRAFLPDMLERGSGVIVNTASVAGLVGVPRMVPYCTTKFAVVGLSESLDMEVRGRGVRVIALCPGLVKTRIVTDGRLDFGKVDAASALEERGIEPAEVAAALLDGVAQGRQTVVVPRHARALWALKRASPRLQPWLTKQIQRRLAR
jgi:NADP-dependent 3-hydroxy acid dehydrogenase YdfG